MRTVVRAALLLSLSLSIAQAADTPAPAAPAPIVLKAAHLFDGRTGQLSNDGVVVVQGAKIVAVGAGATIPAGARVIDLGEATLMPGFIDA
ncbi:MAG TPA: hypothetical protein VMT50_07185, partial [Steroidobacteraceae bacterium]|nr:hypothetical protein [Steroidobacteraceae bacterium]